MAIAKIKHDDELNKSELQRDVQQLQRYAGLASSYAKDLHQRIRIAIRKHGSEAIANEIGCAVNDLVEMGNKSVEIVEKGTGERLEAIDVSKIEQASGMKESK